MFKKTSGFMRANLTMYMYIYIHTHVCVCVCVCDDGLYLILRV